MKISNAMMATIFNTYTGKFGVVHKGKLVADNGNLKVVAIKTIKCKLLSQDNFAVTCYFLFMIQLAVWMP